MAITSLIKYEGDNSTFVWKHPKEDFNFLTQLIVHEGQEALFMMNGQALDLFGPGRYTLDTENIPIIGKLISGIMTGRESPFHCEVYFINKTVQMGLKWGTDSKVRYIDPDYGVPIEIGACGRMNLEVSDSRKLLVKLVGTMKGIAWDSTEVVKGNKTGFTKSLEDSFKPMISAAVKSSLSSAIKAEEMDILEVDEHLESLSATLKNKIEPFFVEYGLSIPQFYISTIVLPEEDKNFQRMRELHLVSLKNRTIKAEATLKQAEAFAEADVAIARRQAEIERQTTQTEIARAEAQRKVIAAQAEAESLRANGLVEAEIMRAKGYNEKDVLQTEVQKAYAEGLGNMGSGSGSGNSAMSDIVGLGIGLKAASAFGSQMGNLFDGMGNNTENAANTSKCRQCGVVVSPNAKFCPECGCVNPVLSDEDVICPACGKLTKKGRFCMECGNPLIRKCPNCSNDLSANAKFCPECGTKL